jgi:excinuclease ABC subunit A
LGQPATTLSGGEAQRVKLAAELGRRSNVGHTLYVLDEPTTGLHFVDVERLLNVLQRLADTDASLIVIEHNLDVIRSADWVIDLGPEGGSGGGTIVGQGLPEEVAQVKGSHTGRFLGPLLKPKSPSKAKKAKKVTAKSTKKATKKAPRKKVKA